MDNMNFWDGYQLIQDSSEHFRVRKTTGAPDARRWIPWRGTAPWVISTAGDENQGLGIGMKDFWQKYPSGLEVSGLLTVKRGITPGSGPPTEKQWIFGSTTQKAAARPITRR